MGIRLSSPGRPALVLLTASVGLAATATTQLAVLDPATVTTSADVTCCRCRGYTVVERPRNPAVTRRGV